MPTIEALQRLGSALRSTGLELRIGDASDAVSTRDELAHQIDDYLVPRFKRLDAPLLVVLGGSTGSGKSTITNALVGEEVSPSGVLRPTTRAPLLICNPVDEPWFAGSDVLPELARVTGAQGSTSTGSVLRVLSTNELKPGLAIIDAPDIDSVEDANRELAAQLLSAADLWLFATTAVRYADAVPWDFLKQAKDRGTALACVVNRIPSGATNEIVGHFTSMLIDAGLNDVQVFAVEEQATDSPLLPPPTVAHIRELLTDLAGNSQRRADVVRQTLEGAMESIPQRTKDVIGAAEMQNAAVTELRSTMENQYTGAYERLDADIRSGTMLRSEVLERWQELIGTAELMRAVQSRISMIRDRLTSFAKGQTGHTQEVQGEITSTLEQLLIDHADRAASSTVTGWKGLPGGRQALLDDRSLEQASADYRQQVRSEVEGWQSDILALVSDRGQGKRTTARILAFGVNSVGIALMLVLFAQTGGITGGEVAIGAGTAGVSQTLLSALFGEQAVRELANDARQLLLDRVNTLLQADADRFRQRLEGLVREPEAVQELEAALADLERVR